MDLSVILVEYFSLRELPGCLEALKKHLQGIDYEVIVSSNSSYNSTQREQAQRDFSGVHWLFHEQNFGFAKAVNYGISTGCGNTFLVMNVDVRLREGFDTAFVYLKNHPAIGVLGPRIVDTAGNLQDSCRRFMLPFNFLTRVFKRLFFRKDVLLDSHFNYKEIQPVDWVIGAFMLIRKDVIQKIGLFDERYFLYVEDMDFCKRVWKNGFEIIYYPNYTVEYKGDRKSLSAIYIKKESFKYTLYHLKSYFLFLGKYFFFGFDYYGRKNIKLHQ